jgi:hypothetical protein
MRFTGQCRCGQLQLLVEAEALPPLYACHCLNCQRWSGSAFGLHMLCTIAAVQVFGEPRVYVYEHGGHTSTQYACATCFTRLFNETTAAPGMRVVRASVLDGSEQLAPKAHIWVKRKQSWLALPAEIPQWAESPTPEAFADIVMG